MADFKTVERSVEAMHWDGKLSSAPEIIEWIESKDSNAELIKRGTPLDRYENAGRNYIRINRWVWANSAHCEIVFDPMLFGDRDKFGAYKTDDFNARFVATCESSNPNSDKEK